MKFRVTFKDPDTVSDACRNAAQDSLEALEDLTAEEKEILLDSRSDKLCDSVRKWVEYGEYITIEFDTKEETAVVVPK